MSTLPYKPGRTATQTWRDIASCLGRDPEIWYPHTTDQATAIQAVMICSSCPVREACLEDALDQEAGAKPDGRNGIRAGLSPLDRYNIHRARYRATTRSAA
jgi:hypothetical protein